MKLKKKRLKAVSKQIKKSNENKIPSINDDIRDWAYYYRDELGFSLVPANTKNKSGTPIKWSPYQKKKPTDSELNNWWQDYKSAGIAVITGKVSNIIVLDIDPKHGGDKTIKEYDIPETFTVRTGSGGWHYYYKYPNDVKEKIKNFTGDNVGLKGVDLRADGGMAYAPPSTHPSGNNYKIVSNSDIVQAPDWLLDIIEGQNKSTKKSSKDTDWNNMWSGVDEGGRNNAAAKLAGKLAYSECSKGEAKEFLKQWNQKNRPPLPQKELLQTIDNIYNKHETDGKKKKDDKKKFSPTEIANKVLELGKKEGNHWCYVPEDDAMYSYRQSDGYWEERELAYLKKYIREILIDFNKSWDRNYKIKEVLDALKHRLIGIKDYDIFQDLTKTDSRFINLENGMLEWQSGKLKKHHPDYYSVFQLPVEYNPNAKCEKWKETLKEWMPSDDTRRFLQEFVGYCLIPETDQQRAVILLGSGSNGKSTFLEVLTALFGKNNLTNIPLNKIAEKFEKHYVRYSLVNICSDIDSNYIKTTGVLKKMISGESLRGEVKHGASFDFKSAVRLLFSTNELPKSKDKSDAWYRRLDIVEFPNSFSPSDPDFDPKLKDKLMEELEGIFLWALEGLKRFKDRGKLVISDEMEKTKEDYEAENDSVQLFVNERLEKVDVDDKQYTFSKKFLYKEYQRFCKEFGLKGQVTRKKWTSKLKYLGFEEARRRVKAKKSIPDDMKGIFKEEEKKKKSERCFIKVKYKK